MSGLFSRPSMPAVTPITAPDQPKPPTPADEKAASIATERDLLKKYNSGRASTILTGQGANNTLG